MKKTYMAPQMEQIVMNDVQILCVSGVKAGGGVVDSGFGGVDTGGGLMPAANEMPDFEDLEGDRESKGLLW